MNKELIMKLARKANLDMWDGGGMGSPEFCSNYKEIEKFAHLIIDECVKVTEAEASKHTYGYAIWDVVPILKDMKNEG